MLDVIFCFDWYDAFCHYHYRIVMPRPPFHGKFGLKTSFPGLPFSFDPARKDRHIICCNRHFDPTHKLEAPYLAVSSHANDVVLLAVHACAY